VPVGPVPAAPDETVLAGVAAHNEPGEGVVDHTHTALPEEVDEAEVFDDLREEASRRGADGGDA
jgi:hypothetical protein